MFNIGMSEFIVIGALALIFIGPKQLPEVARMVGRLLNELKRTSEEVFGSFTEVRTSARRFMDETEKQIEDVYKVPEPVLHKGTFPTEPSEPAPAQHAEEPLTPSTNDLAPEGAVTRPVAGSPATVKAADAADSTNVASEPDPAKRGPDGAG
ncbi:MAG TPA: twin-arginine translocase TatA/TatE family subunit [Bdellovibrionales bacterium]|nr:twin-arginine translocase TatA/TatE family subunit [Bdellovibrionales bacterium]